jgi:hypothetical protein
MNENVKKDLKKKTWHFLEGLKKTTKKHSNCYPDRDLNPTSPS